MPAARLRLDQRRDFVDLLVATAQLFLRHVAVFMSVTLLVVAPVGVVLDGLWGGVLDEGREADLTFGPLSVWSIVVPPLVTALHVRIVQRLGEGVRPTPWAALSEAAGRVPSAVATVALYSLAVAAGFALLLVPGIYLAVRLYFSAQAAVVEELGPVAALRSSAALVHGQWARCLVYLFFSATILALPPALAGDILARAIEDRTGPVGYLAADLVVQAVFMSVTALFGTLLYFDLRLRQAGGDV